MWAFAVLIVVGLGAFVFGVKEVFNGERKAIIQAVGVLALLFIGNSVYGWEVRQEVLIFTGMSIVGGIRFFEK